MDTITNKNINNRMLLLESHELCLHYTFSFPSKAVGKLFNIKYVGMHGVGDLRNKDNSQACIARAIFKK
ncbi:unnamed protein product [Trifolium pratense]|uniref:Uncharacterized protein n=1 Tax=Trifolium pratense TaxID=57577 RepID=A0ACB0JME7_TRIPR|nr:unnamed protein product [Trifolium pratense]